MVPTARSAVFLDTNILIYATFPGGPFHDLARARLDELERIGVLFWTSRQVLGEFLASTTRPGAITPRPDAASLSEAIRLFEAEFIIADDDANVTSLLMGLLSSRTIQGKQIHDANIVATMLRNYGFERRALPHSEEPTQFLDLIDLASATAIHLNVRIRCLISPIAPLNRILGQAFTIERPHCRSKGVSA